MKHLSYWQGRRVLVTGHTGFKGMWLCLWLRTLGADITGYALEPEGAASLYGQCRPEGWMRSVIGDIRDRQAVQALVADCAPEVVIHMAAQPLVRRSYKEPTATYEVNVMGTVWLLEAVREASLAGAPIRAVVNVTSDKCYDNREWEWGYRENEPLGGYDPYSSSKACAELVTAAYRSSYFHPSLHDRHRVGIATARAGNVIGGGDYAEDRLLPDCIRALSGNGKLAIRHPQATRPWQHVLEPLSGYLLLAQQLAEQGAALAEAWNFGPDEHSVRSVEWMTQRAGELWGNRSYYELDRQAQPHEAADLKLDSSKARRRLGWRPRWSVEQAVAYAVSWYQRQIAGEAAEELCLEQIRTYMAASAMR